MIISLPSCYDCRFFVLSLLLLLFLEARTALGRNSDGYKDIFPPLEEEYDDKVIDPNSIFGSPYGGYSRAARSRLASLPLRLPDIIVEHSDIQNHHDNDDEEEEEIGKKKDKEDSDESDDDGGGAYIEVSDGMGREFICRVYHEDELDPASLNDSMFDPPILFDEKQQQQQQEEEEEEEEDNDEDDNDEDDDDDDVDGGDEEEEEEYASASPGTSADSGNEVGKGTKNSAKKKNKKPASPSSKSGKHHDGKYDGISTATSATGVNSESSTISATTSKKNNAGPASASASASASAEKDLESLIAVRGDHDKNRNLLVIGPFDLKDFPLVSRFLKPASYERKKSPEKKTAGIEHKHPDSNEEVALSEMERLEDLLSTHMEGVCVQFKVGWWWYEWCYGKKLLQFVKDPKYNGGKLKYYIKDISSLGDYTTRVMDFYQEKSTPTTRKDSSFASTSKRQKANDKKKNNKYIEQNQKQQQQPLLYGQVMDTYSGGDVCENEKNKPKRQAKINIQCCAPKYRVNKLGKVILFQDGVPVNTDTDEITAISNNNNMNEDENQIELYILHFKEHPNKICNYEIDICLPALCHPTDENDVSSTTSSSNKRRDNMMKRTSTSSPSSSSSSSSSEPRLSAGVGWGGWSTGESVESLSSASSSSSSSSPSSSLDSGSNNINKKNLFSSLSAVSAAATAVAAAEGKYPLSTAPNKKKKKDKESIRDILERVLGHRCLETAPDGWWSYEVCHGGYILQFHEKVVSSMKLERESVFILGEYREDQLGLEAFPNEEEWKHVVNDTAPLTISSSSSNSFDVNAAGMEIVVVGNTLTVTFKDTDDSTGSDGSITRGGNGAYYEQEYIGGDTCDNDEDVTDTGITKIERATTIRYSCGNMLGIAYVKEDSTCHYLMEITIPDLCEHILFKPPISKKQVVKCIPVSDDDDIDDAVFDDNDTDNIDMVATIIEHNSDKNDGNDGIQYNAKNKRRDKEVLSKQ